MTRNPTAEELEQLRHMINHVGLGEVMASLASICADKADSIRTNWKDDSLAALWARNADLILQCNVEDEP